MGNGKGKRTAKEENEMGTAVMAVKNLNAWYGSEKRILSDFSLELEEHEIVGLIGLNGAGKTTFSKYCRVCFPRFVPRESCFMEIRSGCGEGISKPAGIRCLPKTTLFRILHFGNICLMCFRPIERKYRTYRN